MREHGVAALLPVALAVDWCSDRRQPCVSPSSEGCISRSRGDVTKSPHLECHEGKSTLTLVPTES